MKLLGVLIDSDLNFSKHIAQVCRKASQQIGVLSRLKNLVPVPAKLTLLKSAILPHLTYCQKVWHFARASDKRILERIQERALRVINLDKTSCCEDLLRRANPQWATKVLRHFVILEYLRQISLLISTILPPPPFPMLDFRSLEFTSFLYNIEKGEGGWLSI